MMMGGVFAADEDRFGAIIRARHALCRLVRRARHGELRPRRETVPEKYRGPELLRAQSAGHADAHHAGGMPRMGRWIGERLNRMEGPVRFFLPEGGVSALDAPGQPFHDPAADKALFDALERTVRQTATRQLVRLPHNINDPEFAAAIVRSLPRHQRHRPAAAPGSEDLIDGRFRAHSISWKVPRHDGARRADHRRRRRHRAVGEVRGGGRHRPHRHLQFRPLPDGRARLAGRAHGLWRCQRDRHGDGRRGAAGGQEDAGSRRASTAPTRSA